MGGIDDERRPGLVGGLEADVLEQPLEDGVKPARADILESTVYVGGEIGDRLDRVRREIERHLLGLEQGLVLLDQARLGFGQYADEIVAVERLELDADRQPALQLGQQVGGLGKMESARGDEQDVVGLDRAMLGRDARALDQRQKVALHALAAHVGAHALAVRADLVDLVEEDDAVLLDRLFCFHQHLVLVEQLVALLGHQNFVAFGDAHTARALAHAAERLAENLVQVDHAHLRSGHSRNVDGRHGEPAEILHLNLDLAGRQLAVPQHLAELGARVGRRVRADQGIQHPLLGRELGLCRDFLAQPRARHCDRHLEQVAHDLLDIPAHVTDLGELGRLHLEKRRLREAGKAARNLGFAAAGGADHQDVFRQHLLAEVFRELQAPPAISQRHGDRAFGGGLTDDIAVELGDDFTRTE